MGLIDFLETSCYDIYARFNSRSIKLDSLKSPKAMSHLIRKGSDSN